MADPSKLGMEFPVYSIRVEKNKIAEFVAALEQKDDTEQINPLYRDVDAAKKPDLKTFPRLPLSPPAMSSGPGGGLLGTIKAVGADLSKLLHTKEEYEYFAPVCAGDVITRKMKVVDMYERGKKEQANRYMQVTVLETDLINQRGELVIRARTTFMERG